MVAGTPTDHQIQFAPPRPADPQFAPPVTSRPMPLIPDVRSVSDQHLALGAEHAVKPDVMVRHFYTDPATGRLTMIWDDGTRKVPQQRLSEAEREEWKARTGKDTKYLFPADCGTILNRLREPADGAPVLLVEGTFQQAAALSWAPASFGIVGMAGCANWDLPGLMWAEHRDVVVFLDADATDNVNVWWQGYQKLQAGLKQAGAASVKFHESAGRAKDGLDDVLSTLPEDKREVTIGRMVSSAVSRLTKPAPKPAPRTEDPARKLIESADLADNVVQLRGDTSALEWLKAELPNVASFFVRGGQLVHVVGVGDDGYVSADTSVYDGDVPDWYRVVRNGARQVATLTATSLRARLHDYYDFAAWNKTHAAFEPRLFPKEPAELVIADVEPLTRMRPLRGIVTAPVFLRDGRILQEPGYDVSSGYYYNPDPSLRMPPVSTRPDAGELAQARELLDTMLWDFPFVTADDKATYAGYLFLPLLKDMVPPPYKHLGITAPTKGSGKGYLSSAILTIHHGRNGGIVRAGLPSDEAEIRKSVTTILATTAGDTIVFDNVKTEVKGQSLEMLATGATWNDRELGANRNIHEVNDRIWIYNGNNLQVSGDMARRVAMTAIDSKMENPQDRTRFRVPYAFPSWVADNRGPLLWALLTIVRAWDGAGRPVAEVDTSDDYGVATSVLRGILHVAQLRGVGTFDSKQLRVVGGEDEGLARFLAAVYEWQVSQRRNDWWRVHDLLLTARTTMTDVELPDLPGLEDVESVQRVTPQRVTGALKRQVGRPAGGLVLHKDDSTKYLRFWIGRNG